MCTLTDSHSDSESVTSSESESVSVSASLPGIEGGVYPWPHLATHDCLSWAKRVIGCQIHSVALEKFNQNLFQNYFGWCSTRATGEVPYLTFLVLPDGWIDTVTALWGVAFAIVLVMWILPKQPPWTVYFNRYFVRFQKKKTHYALSSYLRICFIWILLLFYVDLF